MIVDEAGRVILQTGKSLAIDPIAMRDSTDQELTVEVNSTPISPIGLADILTGHFQVSSPTRPSVHQFAVCTRRWPPFVRW